MTDRAEPAPFAPDIRGEARTPIPVHVLTGFLGAGKTTLLSRHLASPKLADAALIINEFGEIGLDHLLIESADEDIVTLRGGCLCCQVRSDLIATLEDLLRRRDNGRCSPFRRVIVETTGLADPAPVLHALMLNPYLVLRYTLAAVITVVDAVTGAATLDRYLESVRQVAAADRIVMTKVDLPGARDSAAMQSLKDRLRTINPTAPILIAGTAPDETERLFGHSHADGQARPAEMPGRLGEHDLSQPPPVLHDHGDGPHAHHHDATRHDARIRTFAIREPVPIARAGLEHFLELLRDRHGAALLRLKAIVQTAEDPAHPLVVHGVQHIFHPPEFLAGWPDDDRASRFVFITCDGDEEAIRALFRAVAMAPDAANRARIEPRNPLATPGGATFRPR